MNEWKFQMHNKTKKGDFSECILNHEDIKEGKNRIRSLIRKKLSIS